MLVRDIDIRLLILSPRLHDHGRQQRATVRLPFAPSCHAHHEAIKRPPKKKVKRPPYHATKTNVEASHCTCRLLSWTRAIVVFYKKGPEVFVWPFNPFLGTTLPKRAAIKMPWFHHHHNFPFIVIVTWSGAKPGSRGNGIILVFCGFVSSTGCLMSTTFSRHSLLYNYKRQPAVMRETTNIVVDPLYANVVTPRKVCCFRAR